MELIRNDDELKCPYCLREQSDSWELPSGESNIQCGHCEKYFVYDSEYTRTFISHKSPCLNGEADHQWRITSKSRQCISCGEYQRIEIGEYAKKPQ